MISNTLLKFAAISLMAVWNVQTSSAQIRGDEGSANYLAAQCAASAGLPAENYARYGEKLALTLSFLDSTQQERVFGFLPTPGTTVGMAMASETGTEIASVSQASVADNGGGLIESLLGEVTSLVQGMQQSENPAPSIIAGTPPAEEASGETAGNSSSSAGGISVPEPTLVSGGNGSDSGTSGSAGDDGNNGHGNSGGFDPSNPGNSSGNSSGQNSANNGAQSSGSSNAPNSDQGVGADQTMVDDGNNGHGNSGGFDPSNPGQGAGSDKNADKTPPGQLKK